MPSAIESIIGIFIMSLGNFGDYWDGLEDTGHEFAGQVLKSTIRMTKSLFKFYYNSNWYLHSRRMPFYSWQLSTFCWSTYWLLWWVTLTQGLQKSRTSGWDRYVLFEGNLSFALILCNATKQSKHVTVFQWARIVLLVERGIPPAERLKQQDLYAERMATGQKALVLKQTMSVSVPKTVLQWKVLR